MFAETSHDAYCVTTYSGCNHDIFHTVLIFLHDKIQNNTISEIKNNYHNEQSRYEI